MWEEASVSKGWGHHPKQYAELIEAQEKKKSNKKSSKRLKDKQKSMLSTNQQRNMVMEARID